MKTFIIQTVDNQIVHDFSFHLIEAIKYNNWFQNEKVYHYILTDNIGCYKIDKDHIPIGSVEFVIYALKYYCNIENIKPLNIPQELMKYEYLKRRIFYSNELEDIVCMPNDRFFIKSVNKFKDYIGVVKINNIPKGDYIISEYIPKIESEWRSFVFANKLVGLQNYSGDFTSFPDVDLINEMIFIYDNKSPYTLDVGINNEGTFLIECHDFFSCGLYGFNDYRILPMMFIETWNKLIRKGLPNA